ncbi:hypothetical protein HMPREF0005_01432, partial [Achromobacter xylosoxidans C54]
MPGRPVERQVRAARAGAGGGIQGAGDGQIPSGRGQVQGRCRQGVGRWRQGVGGACPVQGRRRVRRPACARLPGGVARGRGRLDGGHPGQAGRHRRRPGAGRDGRPGATHAAGAAQRAGRCAPAGQVDAVGPPGPAGGGWATGPRSHCRQPGRAAPEPVAVAGRRGSAGGAQRQCTAERRIREPEPLAPGRHRPAFRGRHALEQASARRHGQGPGRGRRARQHSAGRRGRR